MARKPKRGGVPAQSRVAYVRLARACEASAPGEAPDAFRILAAGTNETDKGPLVFTPRSAKLVMDAWKARGNPLVGYYEHEDRLPLEKRAGAPMKGAASAPSSDLAIRGPSSEPECWAEHVAWTEEAKRQIRTGERRQISPVAAFDEETREVLEIINFSLVAEGATHNGTLLASRGGENRSSDNMDEMMEALQSAIEAGDFEEAENIVQKMEAMDGEEAARMARMGKYAIKCAKDAASPPTKAPPEASTKRLAASRDALSRAGVDVNAFDRAVVEMNAATREAKAAATESRRATVQTLIAANRDLFDPADEREHLAAADPSATHRHIASLSRKMKAGIVTLSKPTETTEASPGGKKPEPEGPQATAADRAFVEQFNRSERDPAKHITMEEYLRSKQVHGGRKPTAGVA